MAAVRFPTKTPARIDVATNAHHPYRPGSEARKARGRGGVSSRLADTDATRPEEGEAHVGEDVLRGARVEEALVESGVESE